MISSIISRLVILVFGTLYPAYASYKAVRTKNVKEYVKWMMYWIVFALFTCAETFTDVFCSFWFPFYYEFKVILVLWLLSPATKGSSILYRKFVHPMLTKREQEIDEYIAKAKEQGYHTVLTLGSKGVNYATTVIMQTAIKGGGGLVNQLRRSYSLSDISADMDALAEMNRIKALPEDELDLGDTPMPIVDPRLRRSRGYSPRRSASGSGRVEMYFPEVDVNVRQRSARPRETGIPLSHIRSNEDVSSGYSSAEMLYSGNPPAGDAQEPPLVRTSSVGSSRVTRTKVARGGAIPKRPTAAEDNLSWSESEGSDSGTQEEYFYDVPSAPPPEPVAILPPATPHSMGLDFKSHLPVALKWEPLEPEESTEYVDNVQHLITNKKQAALVSSARNQANKTVQVLTEDFQAENKKIEELESEIGEKNTECADNIQPLTISEELLALSSLPTNQEKGTDQILTEALQDQKDKLEEFKSAVDESTTPNNGATTLLGPVGKETCSEDDTSPFDDAVSFPDVLNNDKIPLSRAVDVIPATVEWEESTVKEEETPDESTPQESEFFDTENDLPEKSTTLAEAGPASSDHTPVIVQEIRSGTKVAEDEPQKPVDDSCVILDPKVAEDKPQGLGDGSCVTSNLKVAEDKPQKPVDDSCVTLDIKVAEDKPQKPVDDSCVASDHKVAEDKPQKPVDDYGRDSRAGRYHKHPAPCPPPQPGRGLVAQEEESGLDRKSPSPRPESSVAKSPRPSPDVCKKNAAVGVVKGKPVEQLPPSVPVDMFEDVNAQYLAHIDKPSGSDDFGPKVFASPNQKRKESKPKQDSTIMSRLLSKPKNQLASFFPFLSTSLTTSLTSLDGDSRAQDRARSGSLVERIAEPPDLPPRRGTPDRSGATNNATRMNIREMSHSPPRRHAN